MTSLGVDRPPLGTLYEGLHQGKTDDVGSRLMSSLASVQTYKVAADRYQRRGGSKALNCGS